MDHALPEWHHNSDQCTEPEAFQSHQTAETPTALSLPALCRATEEPKSDPRHNIQFGHVDLPVCVSPSLISPSRPRSPWGRFDPYESTEVIPETLCKF